MRREQEEQIDPALPALIVVYGATKRKCRPLRGNLVVIGRSPCCDIGIVSPEVAPVHCLLVRQPDGWHIRDCSGRATRLNGRAIHDEPLKNGDNIQVGAFSFEAHLPPGAPPAEGVSKLDRIDLGRSDNVLGSTPFISAPQPAPPAGPGQERLQRSRRRLVELALRLRGRVREQAEAEKELLRRQADLEQVERRLRAAHQQAQAKPGKAEPEPQLGAARAVLDAERTRLANRADELNHFAAHLRKQEQRLREREADVAREGELDRSDFDADLIRERVVVEQERRELLEMRQAMQQRQTDLEATVAQLQELVHSEREQMQREREQILREHESLERQRLELLQQRIALERLQADTPNGQQSASTRDTWSDVGPDRLESARRLLRELAERRRATEPAEKGPPLRLVGSPSPAE